MRVLLDSNIWISAILAGGQPEKILNLAEQGLFGLFISDQIDLEILDVLKNKYKMTDSLLDEVFFEIGKLASRVKIKNELEVIETDPRDNHVLEAALVAGVDFLITGDKHLLELKKFKGIEIVKPTEFLGRL